MAKAQRDEILADYDYLNELTLEGFLWEFIRRNEDYKKLYKKYKDLETALRKLKWYERSTDKRLIKLKSELRKFGLKYLLDPSKKASGQMRTVFTFSEPVEFLCEDDHPDRSLCWQGLEETGHKVAVLIDVKASYEKVNQRIKQIMKSAKKSRKTRRAGSERCQSRTTRSREREWRDYLVAYDLRNLPQKTTIRDISDVLYPKEHDAHDRYCPTCKKARRSINRADFIIKKDYKNFIKPKMSI